MTTTPKPIPDGYSAVTPYLIIADASAAIEFYKTAFDAKELFRHAMPDGKIGHAELNIGGAPIMMADEFPDMGARGPHSLGGSPVSFMLYVENADNTFAKAVAAGATVVRPIENKFYGDRTGSLRDPFGHSWHIATHIEDISPEEMNTRAEAAMQKGDGA